MYKCTACGKIFDSKNALHGHKGKCPTWISNTKKIRDDNLTLAFLQKEYIENNRTANDIAISLHLSPIIDAGTVIEYAVRFGLKTKSVKEAMNNPATREKYEKSCLEKYGKVNALSKNTTSYYKRNATVERKYGVKNVFQLEEIKAKSIDTLYKHHGVLNPTNVPWRKSNAGRKSIGHKIIEGFLEKKGIDFVSEDGTRFSKFNDQLGRIYSPRPDILIEDRKLIIEVNGDKWHANPDRYKGTDIIKRFKGEITAAEIWYLDKVREEHLKSFGYRVVVVWCSQIGRREYEDILNEWLK
jgi:G:T-mismatch repair DNA endonuclease (very short patch repair protein)